MVGSFHGEIGEANALYHGYIPRGKRISLIATNNRWGSRRRWHVLSLIYSHWLGIGLHTWCHPWKHARKPANWDIYASMDLSLDSCTAYGLSSLLFAPLSFIEGGGIVSFKILKSFLFFFFGTAIDRFQRTSFSVIVYISLTIIHYSLLMKDTRLW